MRFSFLSEEKALRSVGLAFPFKHHKSTYQVSTQAPHHLLPSIRRQLSPVNLTGSHRSGTRLQLQSRRLPLSDATDRVLLSLSPIEFDGSRLSIRGLPFERVHRKNLRCEAYLPPLKSQISLRQLTLCFPSLISPSKLHSSPLFSLVGRGVPRQPQDLRPAAGKKGALRLPLPLPHVTFGRFSLPHALWQVHFQRSKTRETSALDSEECLEDVEMLWRPRERVGVPILPPPGQNAHWSPLRWHLQPYGELCNT